MTPSVAFLMADYGHDPTEVSTPYTVFRQAGFQVSFVTENGTPPRCDARMLTGWSGKLLGASKIAVQQHEEMILDDSIKEPLRWTAPDFKLSDFDLVFLPGGHDKGMRQIIDSKSLHAHLASYIPQTLRQGGGKKTAAAICHGVQVLANAEGSDGKSIIHDIETTSLTSVMENSAFWATRLFLGDYYKTFGTGSDNVETFVRKKLDDPSSQFKSSMSTAPFIHEDPKYNYLSGRFPPDAEMLAKRTVELVRNLNII